MKLKYYYCPECETRWSDIKASFCPRCKSLEIKENEIVINYNKTKLNKMKKSGYPLCYNSKEYPKGRHCDICIKNYETQIQE